MKQPGVLKYVKRGKPEEGEEDVMIFIPAKNSRAKQTKTLGKLCETDTDISLSSILKTLKGIHFRKLQDNL